MSLVRYSSFPSVAFSAEDRANRFMLVLMALQRVSYLVPALAGFSSPVYRSASVNLALLVVTLAWNLLLFWRAARLGWFQPGLVLVDLLFAVALLVMLRDNLRPETAGVGPHWASRMAQASAALIGAAPVPLVLAAFGVLVLVAVQAATIQLPAAGGDLVLELVHSVNGLVAFAVVVGFAVRYLRREGRLLARLNAQRLAAESARAADHARYLTRMAHHRALHDTVLATLTAIARGGLDHRTEQVRQRCARDADYVRRLIHEVPDGFTTLGRALHDVVGAAELLGLRVRYHSDPMPAELPQELTVAVRDATREALNNVARHADVPAAWVTATWEGGLLRVTVVDRGRGFDPSPPNLGYGIRRSITDRLASVGGRARVSSAPGEGTCVELTWRP